MKLSGFVKKKYVLQMRYPISDCESLRRAIIFSDQSSFMMKSNTFKTMIAYLSQLSNKRNHLSTVCFIGGVWHFIQTFKNQIQLNSLYILAECRCNKKKGTMQTKCIDAFFSHWIEQKLTKVQRSFNTYS